MNAATGASIHPSSRLSRSEAIISTELDDGVVMMDVEEGRYYELDPVGARVWALTESRPRAGGVYKVLASEYEVPPERCRDEVRGFLDRLLRLGVLLTLPGDEAKETGKDGARERSGDVSDVGTGIGPRGGGEPGGRLAWTTPTIRVMPIAGTASGPVSVTSKYRTEMDMGAYTNYIINS
jgi:hypothetical protein